MIREKDQKEKVIKGLFYVTTFIYIASLLISFYINIKNHRM